MNINEPSYAFWKDEFSNYVKTQGDNIRGVGYWDELTHSKFKSFITTILGHISAKKILDVGGGLGLITSKLAEENHVYNADISVEQLKCSIKRNLIPVLCNAIQLPFKDESFDYIICCGVIQHVCKEDRLKLLEELLRVCKHNGLLFIETLNSDALARRVIRIARNTRNINKILNRDHAPKTRYLSINELLRYVQECNECKIYSMLLIYRPLRDLVTFSITDCFAKSLIAKWFSTDITFVLRKK